MYLLYIFPYLTMLVYNNNDTIDKLSPIIAIVHYRCVVSIPL